MKKKKIGLLFISLLIVLIAFVGCKDKKKEEIKETNPVIETDTTDEKVEVEKITVKWPYYEIKKDGEVKGHLMGTIHIGKEGMYPFPEQIVENLKESENFVTEVDMKEMNSPETQQKALGYMISQEPLTTNMSEESKINYIEILKSFGYSEEMVSKFSKFGIQQMFQAKILDTSQVKNGVDMQLTALSNKNEGQKNIGLETIESQFTALSKIYDEPADINEWVSELVPLEELKKSEYDDILNNYLQGDILKLYETPESTGMTQNQFDLLLTNRNNAWMEKLPSLLEKENQSFIAVGVGHLPGDVGLLKQLESKGYELNLVEFK